MKHGDQKKAAASKTVKKASGSKEKKASGSKESGKQKTVKASPAAKAGEAARKVVGPGKGKGKAADPPKAAKAGSAKGGPRTPEVSQVREARGAAARVEPPAAPAGFSNPALSASFKRAAKKYENAFRRLSD